MELTAKSDAIEVAANWRALQRRDIRLGVLPLPLVRLTVNLHRPTMEKDTNVSKLASQTLLTSVR